MKRKLLGHNRIGKDQVSLYVTSGTDETFWFLADEGRCPEMEIGIGHDDWHQVLNQILHGAIEFALARSQTRWRLSESEYNDHAGYLFVMDHCQYTAAISSVVEWVRWAQPLVMREWRAANRA